MSEGRSEAQLNDAIRAQGLAWWLENDSAPAQIAVANDLHAKAG